MAMSFRAITAESAEGVVPEQRMTQVAVKDALLKIEIRLAAIEKNQEKILEGQTKLSEEHTQLRYWVHRK